MATIYAISRHTGALDWICSRMAVDVVLSHLGGMPLVRGDIVVGLLPAHMAARLNAQGVRYLHLSMELPAALRGVELSPAQMDACNARLTELHITEIPTNTPSKVNP
jgi:CRISPR-associated protein Csx16